MRHRVVLTARAPYTFAHTCDPSRATPAFSGRWGRQVETYSEDPWLTGQLGAEIVRGAQHGVDGGASGNGYLKTIVAVKHATAYQVETDRFNINLNISAHDLADTFYPAWEGVVQDGGASGFMCACVANRPRRESWTGRRVSSR